MKKYELPELPYDYSALEPHLSGQILELHHDKHHGAYVAGANATLDQLAEFRSGGGGSPALLNALEKNLAFHTSGHFLHSIFWTNMSPNGGGEPKGGVAEYLNRDFGNFEAFKSQFIATANGIQGSGWAALIWEANAASLFVAQIYDHQTNLPVGATPIFVLDMWEHAFYLQYKNVKADWVDAYWNLANWDDVENRLKEAQQSVATV